VEKLPEWFGCVTKTIRDDNPTISLLAIESMIEILVNEKVDQIYLNFKK
jgi:hypothetical protein